VLFNIILAGAVLLSTAAFGFSGEPPKRYDYPYRGQLSLYHVSPNIIGKYCDGDYNVWACARVDSPTKCTVYISTSVKGKFYKQIYRHELAHCNGWPGNHPK
jgi:hypothetical protein